MNTQRISRTLVAAMVAASLAGSGSAWADHRNDQRAYGHAQGSHHDKRYDRRGGGYQDRHYSYSKKKKDVYKQHRYKGSSGRDYYRGRGGRYYHHDDDDGDENLLIGLLMGGLIGYAINSAQHDDGYRYESYPQAPAHSPAQTAIYEADTYSGGSCLQEREYQTKVIVGGRSVDAYGTACLQPDGSWSRGPAKLATY